MNSPLSSSLYQAEPKQKEGFFPPQPPLRLQRSPLLSTHGSCGNLHMAPIGTLAPVMSSVTDDQSPEGTEQSLNTLLLS